MKRFKTRLPGSLPKHRLDLFLQEWLPHASGKALSKTQIKTLLLSGSIYVNHHRNKVGSTNIFSGATIEVYFDEEKLLHGRSLSRSETRLDAEKIIFEDEYLLVVNKESGLSTEANTDSNHTNLYDQLKDLIYRRDKVTGSEIKLLHTLDRDASGLVLFTKQHSTHLLILDFFSQRLIQKTYQCIVWRSPEAKAYARLDAFRKESRLGIISNESSKIRYGQRPFGGYSVLTDFIVDEVYRDMYWLKAKPITETAHQIRVQAAEVGLPILGDELYFPEKMATFISSPRLLLHASDMVLIHPITHTKIELNAALPSELVM